MVKQIRLTFGTELGEMTSILIPRAKDKIDLTDGNVSDAMDRIIATQAVYVKEGVLSSREKAEYITTEADEYAVV